MGMEESTNTSKKELNKLNVREYTKVLKLGMIEYKRIFLIWTEEKCIIHITRLL